MPETTEELSRLKKENDHFREVLGLGVAAQGYAVVVKMLKQQIAFLDKFNLTEKIGNATKDDPVYGRAKELVDDMPGLILSLNKLKNELNIEYVESEEEIVPVSPQSIAKLVNGRV